MNAIHRRVTELTGSVNRSQRPKIIPWTWLKTTHWVKLFKCCRWSPKKPGCRNTLWKLCQQVKTTRFDCDSASVYTSNSRQFEFACLPVALSSLFIRHEQSDAVQRTCWFARPSIVSFAVLQVIKFKKKIYVYYFILHMSTVCTYSFFCTWCCKNPNERQYFLKEEYTTF